MSGTWLRKSVLPSVYDLHDSLAYIVLSKYVESGGIKFFKHDEIVIHAVGVQLLPDKYLLIVDISGGRDNFCMPSAIPLASTT